MDSLGLAKTDKKRYVWPKKVFKRILFFRFQMKTDSIDGAAGRMVEQARSKIPESE